MRCREKIWLANTDVELQHASKKRKLMLLCATYKDIIRESAGIRHFGNVSKKRRLNTTANEVRLLCSRKGTRYCYIGKRWRGQQHKLYFQDDDGNKAEVSGNSEKHT